jgi:hypothetical protein
MIKTILYTNEEQVSCDGYDEVQQEALMQKELAIYLDKIRADYGCLFLLW